MAGSQRRRKRRNRRSTRRGEPAAPRFTSGRPVAGWHARPAATPQIVVGALLTLAGALYSFVLSDEAGVSPERTLGYLALGTLAAAVIAVVNEWVERGRAPAKLGSVTTAVLVTAALVMVRHASPHGQVLLMVGAYAAGLAFLIVVAHRDGLARAADRN